jgi:hypothetical protein
LFIRDKEKQNLTRRHSIEKLPIADELRLFTLFFFVTPVARFVRADTLFVRERSPRHFAASERSMT